MAASRTINGVPSFDYRNINTATTTNVKSGSGHLHAVTINTTAAGTISLFDSLVGSGTAIAVIAASVTEPVYLYDLQFNTGLTVVTAAASDVTVSFA